MSRLWSRLGGKEEEGVERRKGMSGAVGRKRGNG